MVGGPKVAARIGENVINTCFWAKRKQKCGFETFAPQKGPFDSLRKPSPPTRYASGQVGGWAGWLGWLAGLAGWAGWLGWLVGWLAGLAGGLAGVVVGWCAGGLLVCWCAGGVLVCWCAGVQVCRMQIWFRRCCAAMCFTVLY